MLPICPLSSVSFFLTPSLPPSSAIKGSCDKIGPTWLIQDNFPISRYLTLITPLEGNIVTGSRDMDIFSGLLFCLTHLVGGVGDRTHP